MTNKNSSSFKKISLTGKNYPVLLKQIYNPPAQLYYQGSLLAQEKNPLAVVGTRKMSAYGQATTKFLVKELVAQGITIISGLALGIDTLAHQTALKAKGKTIAVLGSGLNRVYPQENKKLAQAIVANGGALVSEYPPETPPSRWTFPARNRIISGLSWGTLVIEAPEKSGALITARFSLDQDREVFAVPGSIYQPNSAGVHKLIKMGAHPVTSPEDILSAFDFKNGFQQKQIFTDFTEEKIILKHLQAQPISIEKIIAQTKLTPLKVLSLLTMMEINGKVKKSQGKYYQLK
jgi:DNA processing protein